VIFDGLADPLQPVVAVALSSTCLGLRTPLGAALAVLKGRNARAAALCRKVQMTCAELRDAEGLDWCVKGLTADDMATLEMILRTNGLPRLEKLSLTSNGFGDAGMQALCDGLGRGAVPSLRVLSLSGNKFGPAGAEALAAALRTGARPKLERLGLAVNPIGNQGVAALAVPLRKLPAFRGLMLVQCEIGDEGVASLVDNLGKDDFKALETVWIAENNVTDAGMASVVAALNAGGLLRLRNPPEFDARFLENNPASTSAVLAVKDALAKRFASDASAESASEELSV